MSNIYYMLLRNGFIQHTGTFPGEPLLLFHNLDAVNEYLRRYELRQQRLPSNQRSDIEFTAVEVTVDMRGS